MQNITNQSIRSKRVEATEPTSLYTGSTDSYLYEFWLNAFDASPEKRPKLSAYVESQLLEAKNLWESSPGDTRAELSKLSRASDIVQQFFTCEFDTEGYNFFFSRNIIEPCTSSLLVHELDFTDGLIPNIPRATAEVYLKTWLKLPSSEYLEDWQEENGSLAGGIILRFWNQAFLDQDQNFNHGSKSFVYEIENGAVKLNPDHEDDENDS